MTYFANRYKLMLVVAAAALAIGTSCKSQYELLLNSNDVDSKYKAAFELFEARKYKKAAQMFESLSMLTTGLPKDDTVRYYWALSNYRYKDYVTADANFGSFIESYPRSPFTPDARFLKLDCMYRSTYRYELDQAPTHLAIMSISEFILEYPSSDKVPVCRKMLDELNERLDTKEFEAARLYYKMEDYIASGVSFRNILKDNSDNKFREDILYYIAKSSYKYAFLSVTSKQKERFMQFVDDYFNFVGENPDSKYRKELDQLYARAQKIIGGDKSLLDVKTERQDRKLDRKIERQFDKAD